ncbi:MAG: RNA methyltransferase [Bacteroidaceae bacterium]|nr:RNA methyltransferase [Bacteroidaceae bacterium]
MIISSTTNARIKEVLLLQQKSQERRRQGLFPLEGQRELSHAAACGYRARTVFLCPEIAGADYRLPEALADAERIEVTPQVYARMAYREGTEGVLALMYGKAHGLHELRWQGAPLFVVIEGVEKPGNVGAILRSADAAGVSGVILADPRADLYNPNLIRSSIGSVFTVPVAVEPTEECIAFLKERGVCILTAQLQDSHLYYDTDMRRPTALVMGTEATGLTDAWRRAADAHIRIPMLGRLDSLNVSVSAAVLMYEAVRQRQTIPTFNA